MKRAGCSVLNHYGFPLSAKIGTGPWVSGPGGPSYRALGLGYNLAYLGFCLQEKKRFRRGNLFSVGGFSRSRFFHCLSDQVASIVDSAVISILRDNLKSGSEFCLQEKKRFRRGNLFSVGGFSRSRFFHCLSDQVASIVDSAVTSILRDNLKSGSESGFAGLKN